MSCYKSCITKATSVRVPFFSLFGLFFDAVLFIHLFYIEQHIEWKRQQITMW